MSTAPPNHRASLLAGLRTGGVRSTSASIPQTAAPGSSFAIPRFVSQQHSRIFPDEEEEDQLPEIPSHNMFATRGVPMTAAVDGPNNRFSSQQRGMNPNSAPFNPGFAPQLMTQSQQYQAQTMQMQMLQLEMMKIKAIQTQQYQALAQAHLQQQQQQQQHQHQHHQQQQQALAQSQIRRNNGAFNPPASAGPLTNSFDLRAATLSAQLRRANQPEQVQSHALTGALSDDNVPMTAALGGKFGSRTTSLTIPTNGTQDASEITSPSSTTVISGGTSLGSPISNNINSYVTPSKSDSVSSWRRGGKNNSVLSGNNRAVSSPTVKVSPPSECQPMAPSLGHTPTSNSGFKARPQPLRFSVTSSEQLPVVAVAYADEETDGDSSASSTPSAVSISSPTTPRSSTSSNDIPLSPREEASKKLYEGLGIGRPLSASPSEGTQHQQHTISIVNHRMVSQPTRQPRGPPSGADELGPKNFATRIRRKAIGGLGMLMGARERREYVEAY